MYILIMIAGVTVAIELIIFLTSYINYGVKIFNGLASTFRAIADAAVSIKDCKKENLLLLEESIPEKASPIFKYHWGKMKYEADNYYDGTFIPEAETFFPKDELLEKNGNKEARKTVWRCFLIFSFLGFALPYAYYIYQLSFNSFQFNPLFTMLVPVVGIASFLCGALLWLLFSFLDGLALRKANKEYQRFISAYNKVIPTANRNAAFFFEVSRKDREAISQAVKRIEDSFERFTEKDILPVLKNSIDVITDKQEKGMADLAANFSKELTDTLDIRMTGLAASIGEVQKGLSETQDKLRENIISIGELISGQRSVLEKAAISLAEARKAQEESALASAEALSRFTESNHSLFNSFSDLAVTVDRISDENKGFADNSINLVNHMEETGLRMSGELKESYKLLQDTVEETSLRMSEELKESHGALKAVIDDSANMLSEAGKQMKADFAQSGNDIISGVKEVSDRNLIVIENLQEVSYRTQSSVAEGLKESQDKLIAAVDETVRIFDGFGAKLKEAMTTAGSEISQGIKDATGDNAEAIERLTEQANRLREDYESYFTRIDEYSKTTYEELDYHIHGVIARITEEVGELLRTGAEENRAVLESYRTGTANILASFNEQADSINLYAKEINMDIGELSGSLRDSVAEFNRSLQESVTETIGQFDSGLGELALRLANTVESISDAVEALPTAIKGRG